MDFQRRENVGFNNTNVSTKENQLNIKRATTFKEPWDVLKDMHESEDPMRKAVLCKQLYRMKKKP